MHLLFMKLFDKDFLAKVIQQLKNKEYGLALELLDIRQPYDQIMAYSKHWRESYLFYQYLKAEYDIEVLFKDQPQIDVINQIQAVVKLAYECAIHFPLFSQTEAVFSPFSVGLKDATWQQTTANTSLNPLLEQSMLQIAEKSDGCEPGFIGIQTKDVLLYLAKIISDKQARILFIRDQLKQLPASDDVSRVLITKLYNDYKENLSQYLVKLDYQDINEYGSVRPNKEDLKRTGVIKKMTATHDLLGRLALEAYQYGKTRSFADINTEAILEVIGNDVARVFGMQVQEQLLYFTTYSNGLLKLMLKAAWINGAKNLVLAGDGADNKYLVRALDQPINGIEFVTDHSISNLPHFLALFLAQGDRDGVGSRGQNKLRVDNQLVGIDFGKAYQGDNAVAKNIAFDFSFYLPEYKNYSIFYDSNRSQLMCGIIKLARLAGEDLNPDVLISYSKEFKEEVLGLVPHADEMVFDDYVARVELIASTIKSPGAISQKNQDCCAQMITAIKQAKQRAVEARALLIERFRPFLNVDANVVDLMQSLEKRWAGSQTSLRSPDGTVLLKHLRVLKQPVVNWNINKQETSYELGATFIDEQTAKQCLEALDGNVHIKANYQGKQLTLAFNIMHVSNISLFCHEDRVKKKYHTTDYSIQVKLAEEKGIKMQERWLLECLQTFADYQVLGKFSCDQQIYSVSFFPGAEAGGIDPIFRQALELDFARMSELKVSRLGSAMHLSFSEKELMLVNKILSAVHCSYSRQKIIDSEREVYNNYVNHIQQLVPGAFFSYEYDRDFYQFKIKVIYDSIKGGRCSEAFVAALFYFADKSIRELDGVVVDEIDNGFNFSFSFDLFPAFNEALFAKFYLLLRNPLEIREELFDLSDSFTMLPELPVAELGEDNTEEAIKSRLTLVLTELISKEYTNTSYYKSYLNMFFAGTSDWLVSSMADLISDFSPSNLVTIKEKLDKRIVHISDKAEPAYQLEREKIQEALGMIETLTLADKDVASSSASTYRS